MQVTESLKELRKLEVAELRQKLVDAKQELFNLRFQVATGSFQNNSRIRQVKKEIARIHTVVREQELGIR